MFQEIDICLISSKTGEGIKNLIQTLYRLNKTKQNADFYVIGATNTGKSSFLNLLTKMTWNLPDSKYKKPVLVDALTISKLAGTTQAPIPVKCRSLGIDIMDTQGIPTASQITSLLKDKNSIFALIPSKRIKPIVFVCHENFSFWIGGLARIDMIKGDLKYLTFFVTNLCSVHKTKRVLVEDVYKRQAGKLLYPSFDNPETVEWEKTTVEWTGSVKERADKDISIHGLGWISISGLGDAIFDIYVPKGVGITIRPALMPYETKLEFRAVHNRTANADKIYKKIHKNE